MAEPEDDGSKTEQATEQKLRKAREKGDVPISKEVGHLLIYGALLAAIGLFLPQQAAVGAVALGSLFDLAASMEIGSGLTAIHDLRTALVSPVRQATIIGAGVLGIMLAAAMLSGLLQGPFVVSKERITPKPNKISPLSGIKRIFGVNNLVEFGKSFIKLVLVGILVAIIAQSVVSAMVPGGLMLPEYLPEMLTKQSSLMLAWIVLLMIPITLADIAWKRYRHAQKQRMSLKEVRDDLKDAEGDPLIKAKRDMIRRQRARIRMQKTVPTATLVITNPTHYAVALRYERGKDTAPVCVAKGTDLVAANIRKLAYAHEVPVLESRELARALHATCDFDQTIPEAHWAEVAQLVSFVLDLKKKIRRKPPAGASLRHLEDE
ncbi:EscU/YscU/HrcU family type III secretion system export apparatus switch protein [Neptunicoccus cionae]|uniref:EscU/YscU/HrcU family type III secretion system export apparatus switch protein n=1 Tax=Neptunicoccus cionae TaxID=2035344 RepID=UPI000C783A06|nr:flagellar type III secretion system protein FlhB [Amylibacter cionae]PLS21154.1 flagellar biosynthesis protein FlhB [Amylibacter cionae]